MRPSFLVGVINRIWRQFQKIHSFRKKKERERNGKKSNRTEREKKEKERRENGWLAIGEQTVLLGSPGNQPGEGQNPTEGSGCLESPYCLGCALGPTWQSTSCLQGSERVLEKGTDPGHTRASIPEEMSKMASKCWMGKKKNSKTFHCNYIQKEKYNGYPFTCVLNLEKTSVRTTDSCGWQGFKSDHLIIPGLYYKWENFK